MCNLPASTRNSSTPEKRITQTEQAVIRVMKKDVCQRYTIANVVGHDRVTLNCTIDVALLCAQEMEANGFSCRIIDEVERTIIYETPC